MKSVLIVGGGIVGLATAFKLRLARPKTQVVLLEKELTVGSHQSTHNSGVLHCGLYYKPGSAKARLAVSGIRQLTAFCQKHNIAHEICGKLVIAVTPEEIPRLRNLQERGTANGLAGLRWLEGDALREIEPHAAGRAALHVPEEGIVDYRAVCDELHRQIIHLGGQVVTGAKVTAIHRSSTTWNISSTAGDFSSVFLINTAGLHCDRISRLAGQKPDIQIVPFRGEYFKIKPERQHLVRHLIYPVPDPTYPFLGVHFTRLIHGGIEAGPNAVLAAGREAYRKTQLNLPDLLESLSFPGLWRFISRHPRMCWDEFHRSMSRNLFAQSLQRLVPDLRESDLEPGGAGIRAQAMGTDGTLIQDFDILQTKHALHLLNAPSPAATASLAIADELVNQLPIHN
ncbi:MAG: L-2-hydroxyglutarate oxidase [Verrucomicrobiia bacterium]